MSQDRGNYPLPPEVQPSEEEIKLFVKKAQGGDEAAFSWLYEVYFYRVFKYIVLRVKNGEDAEDLTEDVFLRMLESINSFQVRDVPFSAWILRIAHNRVIDYWRRSKTRTGVPLDDAPPLPSSEGDPESTLAVFSDVGDLTIALELLTGLQRQVLSLRFGASLSVAETAKVMKKNEGAVKALQHSAVSALRRIMAPKD